MKKVDVTTGNERIYNQVDRLAMGSGVSFMGAGQLAENLGVVVNDSLDKWGIAWLAGTINPRVLDSQVGLMSLTRDDRRIMKEIISGADELVSMLNRCGMNFMDRWSRIVGIYGDLGSEDIHRIHSKEGGIK